MKKLTKTAIGIIAVIAAVVLAYLLLSKPEYPDIYSKKPYFGNENASVLVEEFSDFQCPACGAAQPVVKLMLADYGTRIKFRYAQFPLQSIHPFAQKAAEASECANDQGMFFEYHEILFAHQNALAVKDLKNYASQLGMNATSFNNCLDSDAKAAIVQAEQREGTSRGVQGTPTFFVDGKKVESWNYDVLKPEIEAALNK